jgi:hypothetical protein
MNYSFQTSGILRDGRRVFDYQRFPIMRLDESALLEATGLGLTPQLRGYSTRFMTPTVVMREVVADLSIDWDSDGAVDAGPVRVDLNADGYFTEFSGTPDEWSQLVFNGGTVGTTQNAGVALESMNKARTLLPFVELTEEMAKRFNQ